MKKIDLFLGGLVLSMMLVASAIWCQTLSITLHAQWSPNPAADNVIQYKVVVDGGTPVIVPASTCGPTLCSVAFTVTSFAGHNVTLNAQNLLISTSPASLQDSPTVALPFTLNVKAGSVAGGVVGP